jgi:hypothetical protein
MSNAADDTRAQDIVALARRLGLTLTDADLDFALDLDARGRRPLMELADNLPIGVEPTFAFTPPRAKCQ